MEVKVESFENFSSHSGIRMRMLKRFWRSGVGSSERCDFLPRQIATKQPRMHI